MRSVNMADWITKVKRSILSVRGWTISLENYLSQAIAIRDCGYQENCYNYFSLHIFRNCLIATNLIYKCATLLPIVFVFFLFINMAVPRDTATWFLLLLVTLLVVSEVACDTADHSWRGKRDSLIYRWDGVMEEFATKVMLYSWSFQT